MYICMCCPRNILHAPGTPGPGLFFDSSVSISGVWRQTSESLVVAHRDITGFDSSRAGKHGQVKRL